MVKGKDIFRTTLVFLIVNGSKVTEVGGGRLNRPRKGGGTRWAAENWARKVTNQVLLGKDMVARPKKEAKTVNWAAVHDVVFLGLPEDVLYFDSVTITNNVSSYFIEIIQLLMSQGASLGLQTRGQI
ncbi:hypothetical protein R6Q59_026307 [Mikania micrantha]